MKKRKQSKINFNTTKRLEKPKEKTLLDKTTEEIMKKVKNKAKEILNLYKGDKESCYNAIDLIVDSTPIGQSNSENLMQRISESKRFYLQVKQEITKI